MKQIANVKAIDPNGTALVEVIRQGACAHNCASCAGCGYEAQKIEVKVRNTLQVQAGDCIELESRNRKLIGAMALVYLISPLFFFSAYFITFSRVSAGLCAVLSVGAFFLGMIPAIVYDRNLKKNGGFEFTMVRVIKEDT